MFSFLHCRTMIFITGALVVGTCATVAFASHSWGGYHWARTQNPFNLKLGDNLSSLWDSYLTTASNDWNLSSILDTVITGGQSSPKNCRATLGRVEVCNNKYGRNGWLGVATVWVSGSHIAQGTVKVNDTYFNTAKYNTSAWRSLVLCQEIGHTLGLSHQDEDFNNASLGTCMDYSSDPVSNQHPNQHDYDQLALIYEHLDSTTSVDQSLSSSANNIDFSNPKNWGEVVRRDGKGKPSLYEKDLGNGQKVFIFVIWAE